MGSKLENNKCCDAVNASVLKCYGMGTSAVTSKWKLYLSVAGYLENSPREILRTHIRPTNLFNIGSENLLLVSYLLRHLSVHIKSGQNPAYIYVACALWVKTDHES